jgi:polyisoprenoid-binding protein YceI
MKVTLAACLMLAFAPAFAAPINGAQSRIGFTLKQMGVPMQGQFKHFSGDVTLDTSAPAKGKADLTIQIASIGLPTADAIAQTQTADWFNTARFPTARFVATSIKPLGGNHFQFAGSLTIKGTTRSVSAPFTVTRNGALSVADGTLTVSRLAFKVGDGDWADTDTVADAVAIHFHIAFPGNK